MREVLRPKSELHAVAIWLAETGVARRDYTGASSQLRGQF